MSIKIFHQRNPIINLFNHLKNGYNLPDFEPNKKKTLETPIISQISNSSVDGPKYWKTNAPTVAKREIKKMKFASGRTNQNRANKKMHAKGEAYKDKYSAKQKGVDQKNNLRKFLKS